MANLPSGAMVGWPRVWRFAMSAGFMGEIVPCVIVVIVVVTDWRPADVCPMDHEERSSVRHTGTWQTSARAVLRGDHAAPSSTSPVPDGTRRRRLPSAMHPLPGSIHIDGQARAG